MICPACGHDAPDGSAFCNGCGAKLVRTCASCGATPPPGSRYCNGCGADLQAGAPARPKWRRGELNPRPEVFDCGFYVRSLVY